MKGVDDPLFMWIGDEVTTFTADELVFFSNSNEPDLNADSERCFVLDKITLDQRPKTAVQVPGRNRKERRVWMSQNRKGQ